VTLFAGQAANLNRRRAGQIAGYAAAMIGIVAFTAVWWAPAPLPPAWGAGFAIVKPTTALCLAALGLVLMQSRTDSRFTVAVSLAVTAVAILDLLEMFGVDYGIDGLNRLVVTRNAAPGPDDSFHQINGMPLALLVAVASLGLSRFERHRFAATALGGMVGVIAMFALLDYLAGSRKLFGAVAVPSLLTAINLLCVAVAIVLRIGITPALRKPRPLWQLLTVLGSSIIAPLLLFGVYMGLRITDTQLGEVQNGLRSEARTLSADVDREVIGEIERLQALAASASLRQGDFAEFQRQAEASLAWRRSGNIVLIDRSMQELVNTWAPYGAIPLGRAAAPESLVEKSLATGRPQVAGLFTGAATRRLMFSIIVPVRIDGVNRYVLARSPDLSAIAALINTNELPPGWHAAVSDATHRIIARSDRQDAFVGEELPRAQWHGTGADDIFEFVDSEGQASLRAYVWSELTGWQTSVWAPTVLLGAPVRALWWTIVFGAALSFALVVSFALWLSRIIAGSVGHAARAAIALGKGGPLPMGRTPVAEIDTLMEELRVTAAELRETAAMRQAAERNLQTSKDHLQLAFDATQLAWWQYDPLRRVYAGDARFKEIFDVAADQISVEDIMERVYPDDRERFRAHREAALDSAHPQPYLNQEYRIRRRDGTVRWVEADALAYFDGDGPERHVVSFGGTVQDITDRKEREEKEHLLMREVNHRAKNMLSVVASIAHHTAARNPDDFVERFAERIQALSANQDLLVRSEWSGVEIAHLVRAQLAHFADLIGSRIALQGPALRLTPASAQAVGLALHELATNAGKYGALSNNTGRVDVRWGMAGDTLTMSWTEHDGPRVSTPRQHGFGSTVMEAMAARSVGGEVHLDYAPSGVVWRLTCPAANALELGPGTVADSDAQAQ
jgi:PAS domain S-box-containing protein